MIKEDYVSFEIAKLLKEKGFDVPCLAYWFIGSEAYEKFSDYPFNWNEVKSDLDWLSRPTLQMTMRWLREVHHYYIQVMLDSWACGGHMGYYVVIQKTDSDFEMMLQDVVNDVFYKTYEQSCEAAIKYCLENLI